MYKKITLYLLAIWYAMENNLYNKGLSNIGINQV
jgi:hypothetical protein